MRFALCTVTYNDHSFLPAFLRQVPDYVETILVLVSEHPWYGLKSPEEQKTLEILRDWPDPRVKWVRQNWRREEIQRTWGLAHLAALGFDWVFTLDTDEFFTPDDWTLLKKELEGAHLGSNVAKTAMETYWKDFDHSWEPRDRHQPTIAVRPAKTSFFDKRETPDQMFWQLHTLMHHLSWVRTDEEVKQKIQNYMHALDFDTDAWYNIIWKEWTPDMKNIRPYGVEGETKAVRRPLPEPIRSYFRG